MSYVRTEPALLHMMLFYAPNFEKVGSILVSACAFVLPSVQKKIQARVLKFHIWIPRQKYLIRKDKDKDKEALFNVAYYF